ncbi:MAG: ferric reductase-like transmembrane domain-containing protein, partial [Acidobacteria bacterium]|nr:ferric reductase-like transmembrane domain-containing protein [Acidobacteriota bacterium]
MSTSERVFDSRFTKWLVTINGLVPGALLLWDAWHGQLGVNNVNFAIRTTGLVGLVFITLSLVITPLRALTGWHRVVAVRRNLGVLGFVYLAAHFLIFFWWDRMGSVSSTANEVLTRKYLWFGTGALLLMIPLTVTSTDTMVSKLGAVAWKRLHRLAYVIAIGAVIHYYLLVKSDVRQPVAFGIVIGVLLLYRVVRSELDLRGEVRELRARKSGTAREARKRSFWSGELVIARVFDETPDVKTFRLASPDGGPLPFTHVAGQYLNLALMIGGKRVNRSYTIASPPTRHAYCEISVKRAVNGYASVHLHETWRAGQRVNVSAPGGQFVFRGDEARRVLLIAGGIGIT